MTQLSKETKKSSELEHKIQEIENQNKENNAKDEPAVHNFHEFGTWISEKDQINIDIKNIKEVEKFIEKGNSLYEIQLKNSLEYFHEKFKTLYDKISAMVIQSADDNNKWSILEEQYKAQIESLKGQIEQQEEEDISENSPGLISIPSVVNLQRKCSYLEDSYKYIRTLNENIKNENMDAKRQIITMSSEYETEIQRLILTVANLSDKLRNTIPAELFWKQNYAHNEIILKYRKIIEDIVKNKTKSVNLLKRLENDKLDIINNFKMQVNQNGKSLEQS